MNEKVDWTLLAKFFAGEANEQEKDAIAVWLQNPENKKEFDKARAAWEGNFKMDISFDSDRIKRLLSEKINLHEMEQAAEQKEAKQYQLYQEKQKNSKQFLSIAATVIMLMLVGLGTYNYFLSAPKEVKNELALIEKSNPKGRKSTIKLPDGSTVHLNAESLIKIPEHFAANKREVYLEGEAFFEIERDENRPFLVHSADMVTRVLGTSFNVKAFPSDKIFEVVVATGKVGVSNLEANEPSIVLVPNEQGSFNRNDIQFSKKEVDIKRFLCWKDGILLFQDEKIGSIIPELERWFGVEITVKNKEIEEKKFTGEFENMSLEHVLKGMNFSLGFDYSFENDTVILFNKN
ncbi:FecR family protein [Chondrinema litorale]|uniref:FecR family protein n=1 Tax=Chondrinema litorale TaxID=2994555 RepID=UPI0025434F9D|nr:FecR domain-containing protein [Chondrinema litorale]UZR97323.1 DUF4974 domain-containing protein [Chondrinema litorale]